MQAPRPSPREAHAPPAHGGARALPDKERAQALLAPVHQRLVRERLGWYKNDVFEVSRAGLRSRRLERRSLEFWRSHAGPLLWQVLNDTAPRLYEQNPWVQKVLGLDRERLSYLRAFRQPGQPVLDYFGVDSLRENGLVVDINNRPGVLGYFDEIRRAYGHAPSSDGPSFNEALFGRLSAYSPEGLLVVLPERGFKYGDKRRIAETVGRYPGQTWSRRLSELAELPDSELPGVALLTMIPASMLDERRKFAGLLSLARRGVPIVNAPEGYLVGSKTMMHLLAWSPLVAKDVLRLLDDDPARARAKRRALQELFVPSTLIHDGTFYGADGNASARDYLTSINKNRQVVKEGCSSGGWGVYHGRHLTKTKWRELVERVCEGGTWVVEAAQEHEREDIWGVVTTSGGDDVGLDDAIAVERVRARILYRSYFVRGENVVYQEIFAGRGWKVSAAGWSLPAQYEDQAT